MIVLKKKIYVISPTWENSVFQTFFFFLNKHLKLQIKWWRGERERVGCPRHAPRAFGDLVPCSKVPRQCSERVLAALLLPTDFSNFARRANTTSFLFICLWPWKFAKSVVAFVTLYPLIKTVFICRFHCVVFYLESYFSGRHALICPVCRNQNCRSSFPLASRVVCL